MKSFPKFLMFCLLVLSILSAPMAAYSNDSLSVNIVQTDKKVGNLRFVERDSANLILRVMDKEGVAFKNLNRDQVVINRGAEKAKILKVEPLRSTVETNLNVVLMLDNSSSMQSFSKELLESVNLLLNTLKGKSRISLVVFSESDYINLQSKVGDEDVHISNVDFTDQVDKIKKYATQFYNPHFLSQRTYLHDGILFGLQQIETLPKNLLRIMIVFSDGKDLGSKFGEDQVFAAAANAGITIYGIDFNPDPKANPLMQKLPATTPQGKTFSASKAADLLPVFDQISKEITTEFQVTYHFPIAPTGDVNFVGDKLVITTRRLLDEFPMLYYVFFDSNSVDAGEKYYQFKSQEEAAAFDENNIQNPMDKYYHILNIIGSRAQKNPQANLTLIGCNMNCAGEKLNKTLSHNRAENVAKYLENIWGINKDRMKILARNLPEKNSSTRTAEGCAENRRVEIISNQSNILSPIRSEVKEFIYEPEIGYFSANIVATEGLDYFEFTAFSNGSQLISKKYNEAKTKISWNWINNKSEKIDGVSKIDYGVAIKDKDGSLFESVKKSIPVDQLEEATTQVETAQDTIFEKMSLVLFDFNSSQLSAANKSLMKKALDIYNAHDGAFVKVFGYCDDIGDEDYNMKLSTKRAKIAFDILRNMGVPKRNLNFKGYGEINPIFSNLSPEGRFLNRTVQIYIGYPNDSGNE